MTPPSGYGVWAISIQTAGSSHVSVVTCGYQIDGLTTVGAHNARLRTAMALTGSAFAPAQMGTSFTVINTYCLQNFSGLLTVSNNPTPIVGTLSVNNPPLNTAMIVQKVVALAGRQYRGRFFSPPMSLNEANVSVAGLISAGDLPVQQGRWTTFYNGLVAQPMLPMLLHDAPLSGPTPGPTTITNFSVTQLIGTIKRRIR